MESYAKRSKALRWGFGAGVTRAASAPGSFIMHKFTSGEFICTNPRNVSLRSAARSIKFTSDSRPARIRNSSERTEICRLLRSFLQQRSTSLTPLRPTSPMGIRREPFPRASSPRPVFRLKPGILLLFGSPFKTDNTGTTGEAEILPNGIDFLESELEKSERANRQRNCFEHPSVEIC